ncbi:ATP-dependent RNA helicase DbpA [Nitrincola sp. MINF-07-Sa-05]|uniref:ATP-dependent RNA helicase DbpA n=1 Tax=Nitrincola salilacus TaxID=3400273 RepID=UPI00391835A9
MNTTSFAILNLPETAIANLTQLGYETMTPIQAQSLPPALEGRDLIAQAQTGSGKTAAFGIGMLEKLNPRSFSVQGLVLCPTRELATQVANELRRLARYLDNIKIVSISGGQPMGPQIGSLEHGAHIVVGTPGRLCDHLRKGTLVLDRLNTLVLDEADRMLDMGFEEDISAIISSTPDSRQTLLFSATYPEMIEAISARYQREPVRVSVETQHDDSSIQQFAWPCEPGNKAEAVHALLQKYQPDAAVIFCNTRQACNDLATEMKSVGLRALVLHGDMDQLDRDQVLIQFSNGSFRYLIATDVAARGLDIDTVDMVINADLPQDPAIYTHRIGRTGRAGRQGIALSLYSEKDSFRLQRIDEQQRQPVKRMPTLPAVNPQKELEQATMATLCIAGGRKEKLRPGDILGALTVAGGLDGSSIGKINITNFKSFVAVERSISMQALEQLREGKIKGRQFKVRRL